LAEGGCQRRRGDLAIPKWDWSGGSATRRAPGGRRSDGAARALCQPGGCAACRIDSRANLSRESAGAARFTPGTGVFSAQVIAVDVASGAVARSTMGGWSCSRAGPVKFDSSYEIDGLAVGHSYIVYAEALNGAVSSSSVSNAIVTLCRNAMTDPGWPLLQGCVVPSVDTSSTTRARPGP